jgi:hypothetical protein
MKGWLLPNGGSAPIARLPTSKHPLASTIERNRLILDVEDMTASLRRGHGEVLSILLVYESAAAYGSLYAVPS